MQERYFEGRPEKQDLLAEQERYLAGTLPLKAAADYLGIGQRVVLYLSEDIGLLPFERVNFPSLKGRVWWRSALDTWLDLPNREWLTLSEASQLFGRPKGIFSWQVKHGELTGIKGKGEGQVYYLRADLELACLPVKERRERVRQLAEA